MISRLLNFQSKTITFAAVLIGSSALISRFLGLIRDRLLAGNLGAAEEFDIYLAAFRVPDFIYGIFILGGISAVFLPLFSEYFEKSEKEAWEFVNNLLHVFVCGLAALAVILFFLAPWLAHIVAPGFSSESKEMTVGLTRLMLLSPILFGISSVFSGVLQYFNRFLAYSLAPIMYNLGIIGGILFLLPKFGLWGLGMGVVLGAGLHVLIQIPSAIKSGFVWHPVLSLGHPSIWKVLRLALPRTVGVAGYHINLIVMTALASTFSMGSIAIFILADDIQHVPVGLVGIPFALASFAALSRFFAQKNLLAFQETFFLAFRRILFLTAPFVLFLFLGRKPLTQLIYGTGRFGTADVQLTAAVLGVFTFGILFQALIPLLARAFFSLQDTKTPTVIGLSVVALNIILALAFTKAFQFENFFSGSVLSFLGLDYSSQAQIVALPLALTISALVQFSFLFVFLKKRMKTNDK